MKKENHRTIKAREKYVGEVFKSNNFGYFEVIEYRAANDVVIRFLQTGWVDTVSLSQVGTGLVKDCMQATILSVGIVGNRLSKEEMQHKAFKNWHRILIRCYDEKQQEKQPTYKGCYVSDYFLKYQNFKEWYTQQPNWDNPKYVLDKDLLVKGNKVYSPDTCCFIPVEINSLLTTTNKRRGDTPIGVCVRKKRKGYQACLRINGKDRHLGSFDCPIRAFEAYKVAREAYYKEKAEQWKGKISGEAYEALKNRKVEITD